MLPLPSSRTHVHTIYAGYALADERHSVPSHVTPSDQDVSCIGYDVDYDVDVEARSGHRGH